MGIGEFSADVCYVWRADAEKARRLARIYGEYADSSRIAGANQRAALYLELIDQQKDLISVYAKAIVKRQDALRRIANTYNQQNEEDISEFSEIMRGKAGIDIALQDVKAMAVEVRRIYLTSEAHPRPRPSIGNIPKLGRIHT